MHVYQYSSDYAQSLLGPIIGAVVHIPDEELLKEETNNLKSLLQPSRVL